MANYRAVVLSDAPVSYWRLDEASGTTAADQQGAYAATYAGTFTLKQAGALAGDPDTSVLLDGTSGQVSVPFTAALNTAEFTVEAWVRPIATISSEKAIWASRTSTTSGVFLYGITTNQLNAALYSSGINSLPAVNNGFVVNRWSYVALSYDGATARLYLNGTQASFLVLASYTTGTRATGIGADAANGIDFWDGDIDEVAYYNYPLSAAQIMRHYAAGIAPPFAFPANRMPLGV